MVDKARWLNLDDIMREVTETSPLGPDDLAAWGGAFDALRLGDFLQVWGLPRLEMPWSLWQWTDRIIIERGSVAHDLDHLERGRVFGPGGDLSLRRDGGRVLWHFVGPADAAPPSGFSFASYWDGREDAPIRLRERTALLWGEERRDKDKNPLGVWYEDRVAAAALKYPLSAGARRVQVCYREYLHGGCVELVWLLELEEHNVNRED